MLCLVCGAEAPLGFISHLSLLGCVNAMKAELAEWRTGKRRVYWRIKREAYGKYSYDGGPLVRPIERKELHLAAGSRGFKAIRVTVGPACNVRPWRKK